MPEIATLSGTGGTGVSVFAGKTSRFVRSTCLASSSDPQADITKQQHNKTAISFWGLTRAAEMKRILFCNPNMLSIYKLPKTLAIEATSGSVFMIPNYSGSGVKQFALDNSGQEGQTHEGEVTQRRYKIFKVFG